MTNRNNYPFYGWIPKPLGAAILVLFFVPLFFSGGTYLSNANIMAGGMGILTEDFQFLSFCVSIGMSLVFPFMIPYLQARNVKHVYLGGFASLIVLNWICANTQSLPLLAGCCFVIGFIRVGLTLNTTFIIAPYALGVNTIDMFTREAATPEAAFQGEHARTVLMAILYTYILILVQGSNYVMAWVAHEFRWEYSYYFAIGLLLAAMLITLVAFCPAPTRRWNIKYSRLADALLLAAAMGGFCYMMVYGKIYDWFDSPRIWAAFILTLVCGGAFLWLEARTPESPLLESGTFRHRNTWIAIGIFLLTMLINSSTLFVTTFVRLSTNAGELESAAISCWAIPGLLAGLVLSLVFVKRHVPFRYIYATGFGLMLCANLYMYFQYQTMGVYEHSIFPTIIHWTGMLLLYSIPCAFALKHIPIRYFATWLFLMVAVRNVVATAIGTSVYGNWLQERQQHYITRLAQDIRSDNPVASSRFLVTAHMGQAQGQSTFEADRLAATSMKGQLTLQATLVAMKDITGSTIWICLACTAFILLIPYYKNERT